MTMSAAAEIQDFVRRLNAAWLEGRPDDLSDMFHDNMVLVVPRFVQRLVGRQACVESYRGFVSQAGVRRFDMGDPQVDVFSSTAVAACPYTVEYETEGKRWRSSGQDLLVLVEEAGAWLVAWRTLLPESEEEIGPSG